MKKKLLALTLSLVMVASLFAIAPIAAVATPVTFNLGDLTVVNPRDPENPLADVEVNESGKTVTIKSSPSLSADTYNYPSVGNVVRLPHSIQGDWEAVVTVTMSSNFSSWTTGTTAGLVIRDPANDAFGLIAGRKTDTSNIKGHARPSKAANILDPEYSNTTAGSNMGTGASFQVRIRKSGDDFRTEMYRTNTNPQGWFGINTGAVDSVYTYQSSFYENAALELFVLNPGSNELTATFAMDITYANEAALSALSLPDPLEHNYQLPAKAGGFDLTWTCDTEGVLGADGRTIVSAVDQELNVTLMATAAGTGYAPVSRSFPVTIAVRPTPEEMALAAISLPSMLADGYMLPGQSESRDIAWACSDPAVLNGNVIVGKDTIQQVTLTATIGGYTRNFTVYIWTSVVLEKSVGNPISQPQFSGDPAGFVDGDTLYIMGGHDASTSTTNFDIPEWVMYSTKDLVNWTYHGSILNCDDVEWMRGGAAWASQIIPYNGKYYLYTSAWGSDATVYGGNTHIGVAVSDTPTGPYVDIGQPLVENAVTTDSIGLNNYSDIDPTVLVTTVDGEEHRYLSWGNGRVYVSELNEDMISIKDRDGDGEITFRNNDSTADITRVAMSSYVEGTFLYKRNGIFYNFYPGGGQVLNYSRTTDVWGPWQFGSRIMEVTLNSSTNHPAVVDFKGKTYLIYHNGMLPNGCGFRRSICVQELKFDDLGFVYPMHELSIGVSGVASTLKTASGDYVGYTNWSNAGGDNGARNLAVAVTVGGAGGTRLVDWEVIQGRGNAGNVGDEYVNNMGEEYVGIQAVHKPGLLITATSATAVRLQHDSSETDRGEAQTFRTVKGLAGNGGVSFENLKYPGRYLCNQNGTLTLSYVLDANFDSEACTFFVDETEVDPYKPIPTAGYPFDDFVPDGDYAISYASISETTAKVTLDVNDSLGIESVNLILVIYDADGRLQSVQFKPLAINDTGVYGADFTLNTVLAPGDTYKVFAWDAETFVPLCAAVTG